MSIININTIPTTMDKYLFFIKWLEILPHIKVNITQFNPINKGTPNNFNPRLSP